MLGVAWVMGLRRPPDGSTLRRPGLKPSPLLLCFLLLLPACRDQGPVSGPGVITATLVSPNGSEGAAIINLLGEGIGGPTGLGDTEAFAHGVGTTMRVVLINQAGGDLSFQFQVRDTLELPEWVVIQVAGPNDSLRSVTAGYELELVP